MRVRFPPPAPEVKTARMGCFYFVCADERATLFTMLSVFLITLLLISLATLVAVPLVFLLELIGWSWTGVPYVPIPKGVLKKLPEALALNNSSALYDLGCGDGRILYTLARTSTARFVGVEKAPFPYLASLIRGFLARKKNVRIKYGDIFKTQLSDASHVYVYLLSDVMDKLLPKFERELKKGTRVVSCDFQFKTRVPSNTIPALGGKRPHILYVYDF